MDIFEQEYTQGLRETAADQFTKLAAAIDGADFMGKTNPTGEPDHPAGVDARSLDEGLSVVERLREGRGKSTAVTEKQYPTLKQRLHRDVMPVLSGGIEESDANYADDTSWTKLAASLDTHITAAATGAIMGTLAGAATGATTGAVTGAIANPKDRVGTAGRGAITGAGYGAITGGVGGALMGALAPSRPDMAAIALRSAQVGSVLGGIKSGLEESERADRGIKERWFQDKDRNTYSKFMTGQHIKKASERADNSPAALMMKVAAEGKVHTLEGWSKTANASQTKIATAQRVGRTARVLRKRTLLDAFSNRGSGSAQIEAMKKLDQAEAQSRVARAAREAEARKPMNRLRSFVGSVGRALKPDVM